MFGFERVNVIVLVPPAGIEAGAKALAIVGFATARSVSVAGSGFVDPSTVASVLAAIVLT